MKYAAVSILVFMAGLVVGRWSVEDYTLTQRSEISEQFVAYDYGPYIAIAGRPGIRLDRKSDFDPARYGFKSSEAKR